MNFHWNRWQKGLMVRSIRVQVGLASTVALALSLVACGSSGQNAAGLPSTVRPVSGPTEVMYECGTAKLAPRGILPALDHPYAFCSAGADGAPEVLVPGGGPEVLSPDGTSISFGTGTARAALGRGSVGVMDNTGANRRSLWNFPGATVTPAEWSADGNRLAVVVSDLGYSSAVLPGLWVVDVRSGKHKRLTADGSGPVAWNPNGTSVAFATDNPTPKIEIISTTDGSLSTLRTAPVAPKSRILTLSWAPDGRTILASYYAGLPGSSEIHQVALDGKPPSVLVKGSASSGSSLPEGRDYLGAIYAPDGRHFAVAVGCNNSFGGGPSCQGSLDIANLDGSGLKTIVSGSSILALQPICWVREPANVANPVAIPTSTARPPLNRAALPGPLPMQSVGPATP